MKTLEMNEIGLTHFHEYVDSCGGTPLDAQLDKAGVPYQKIGVPHLVGINAHAELIRYTSPQTGKPIAVLCIIDRYEIDDFAISYYYREGTTQEEALRDEQFWLDWYERARELVK